LLQVTVRRLLHRQHAVATGVSMTLQRKASKANKTGTSTESFTPRVDDSDQSLGVLIEQMRSQPRRELEARFERLAAQAATTEAKMAAVAGELRALRTMAEASEARAKESEARATANEARLNIIIQELRGMHRDMAQNAQAAEIREFEQRIAAGDRRTGRLFG
jgi:chromosome segregation ATPase